MFKILVIAGTSDARQIIEKLIQSGACITATAATQLGGTFLKQYEEVDVRVGRLTLGEMMRLIDEIKAACIVDASHPFAENVSANAIEAAKRMSVPYLRYERPETVIDYEGIIRVRNFEEAVERLKDFSGNIFMAIGSGKLELFTKIPDFKRRMFVRVLPESKVLEKCEKLGFDAENILALKGPFSESMNIEALKHFGASVMVTKDSGSAGGNEKKISAARKLGIPVIMVERPRMDYGFLAGDVLEVVDFIEALRKKKEMNA